MPTNYATTKDIQLSHLDLPLIKSSFMGYTQEKVTLIGNTLIVGYLTHDHPYKCPLNPNSATDERCGTVVAVFSYISTNDKSEWTLNGSDECWGFVSDLAAIKAVNAAVDQLALGLSKLAA